MSNTRRQGSRQRGTEPSVFQGTDRLKFTAVEQELIRNAEQAYWYQVRPRHEVSLAGAAVRLIATILGLAILGSLGVAFFIGPHRGASSLSGIATQVQGAALPPAHSQEIAHNAPTAPADAPSIGQLPLPAVASPRIMPEIEPHTVIVSETGLQLWGGGESSEGTTLKTQAGGGNLRNQSSATSEANPEPGVHTGAGTEEPASLAGAEGPSEAEEQWQISEGRWLDVEAYDYLTLFAEPRFDARVLTRIIPRSRYFAIDTRLACNETRNLTWKLVVVQLPNLESFKGFVCTPEKLVSAKRMNYEEQLVRGHGVNELRPPTHQPQKHSFFRGLGTAARWAAGQMFEFVSQK